MDDGFDNDDWSDGADMSDFEAGYEDGLHDQDDDPDSSYDPFDALSADELDRYDWDNGVDANCDVNEVFET